MFKFFLLSNQGYKIFIKKKKKNKILTGIFFNWFIYSPGLKAQLSPTQKAKQHEEIHLIANQLFTLHGSWLPGSSKETLCRHRHFVGFGAHPHFPECNTAVVDPRCVTLLCAKIILKRLFFYLKGCFSPQTTPVFSFKSRPEHILAQAFGFIWTGSTLLKTYYYHIIIPS